MPASNHVPVTHAGLHAYSPHYATAPTSSAPIFQPVPMYMPGADYLQYQEEVARVSFQNTLAERHYRQRSSVGSFLGLPRFLSGTIPGTPKTRSFWSSEGFASLGRSLYNFTVGGITGFFKSLKGMFTDDSGRFSLPKSMGSIGLMLGIGALSVCLPGVGIALGTWGFLQAAQGFVAAGSNMISSYYNGNWEAAEREAAIAGTSACHALTLGKGTMMGVAARMSQTASTTATAGSLGLRALFGKPIQTVQTVWQQGLSPRALWADIRAGYINLRQASANGTSRAAGETGCLWADTRAAYTSVGQGTTGGITRTAGWLRTVWEQGQRYYLKPGYQGLEAIATSWTLGRLRHVARGLDWTKAATSPGRILTQEDAAVVNDPFHLRNLPELVPGGLYLPPHLGGRMEVTPFGARPIGGSSDPSNPHAAYAIGHYGPPYAQMALQPGQVSGSVDLTGRC